MLTSRGARYTWGRVDGHDGVGRAISGHLADARWPDPQITDTPFVKEESSNEPWWAPTGTSQRAVVVRNAKKRILFALTACTLGLLLLGAAFAAPQERQRQLLPGIAENPPTLDALVATCTGIIEWDQPANLLVRLPWNPRNGSAEKQVGEALRNSVLVRPGFYEIDAENMPSVADIASYMSRGGAVAWYSVAEDDPAYTGLRSATEEANLRGLALVALPWPEQEMGRLPSFSRTTSGRNIIYMKWGTAQSCAVASAAVLEQFLGEQTKRV